MSTTVVIPAYKAEKTIRQAVASVLESIAVETNVIVVEDGVYDKTAEVLAEFGNRVSLHTFPKNQGAQKARNFGLSLVNTEFVMFLDSDDYLKPDFLYHLEATLSGSDAGLAFGAMEFLFEDTGKTKLFVPPEGQSRHQIAERWLRGQPGPHPCGILWRTDVVRSIGGWHEGMSRNQDGEIVLRALSKGHEVVVSNESASVYRCHGGERVSGKVSEHTFECQEVILNLMESWASRDKGFDFRPALSEFCIYVAMKAYRSGLDETGRKWEGVSRSYSRVYNLIWFGGWKRKVKFFLVSAFGVKFMSNFFG